MQSIVNARNDRATHKKSRPGLSILQKIAKKINLRPELVQDVYPCTSLQASLLAASLHGLGSYISIFVFDLSSTPHTLEDVKRACEIVYSSTPILRTRFLESKGKFLQAVTSTCLEWEEYESLEAYIDLDRDKEMRLGDPVARFAWISASDNKVYMVWSLHHALYDEWSINLLFDDLTMLASSSIDAESAATRPKFSRFVKALLQKDQNSSTTFWQKSLKGFNRYPGLLPGIKHAFETSSHVDHAHSFDITQTVFQPSTLAIAAWSIFAAKLSGSETVAFGNVVNGRTAHVPGIVDICGPTMTTVPYVVDVAWQETVGSLLEKLEQTRKDMLRFEQAGLDEYRRATGAGRFDALLSIRSSQTETPQLNSGQRLEPSAIMGRGIHHPCLLYLDVVFETRGFTLKASFDERYVEKNRISEALKQFSICLCELTTNSDIILSDFSDSMEPSILKASPHSDKQTADADISDPAIDFAILSEVQKAARTISPMPNLDEVVPETTLEELGLDSLSTVIFARKLSKLFKITVPFRHLTGLQTTVSKLSTSIQKLVHGSGEDPVAKLDLLSLAERYVKDFRITNKLRLVDTEPSDILLTGATGYVGAGILRRLLTSTTDRIILLVRCESSEQGLERIHRIAQIARWKTHELALLKKRIQVWPSDLEASRLGLSDQQLHEFKYIHTIVHSGARVDFSLGYHDLETTNVSATAFLLSQHLNSVLKPCFVYLTGGRGCPLNHKEPLQTTAANLAAAGGYAQSKFVSEVLIHRAQDLCKEEGREVHMTIVHPGLVIGNETAGVANVDDFIWRYVAASLQMQVYVPAVPTKREWINLMTIDLVASETVSAALITSDIGKVDLRLMRSGLPVARFWEVLHNTVGTKYALESVSEWEWLRRLEGDLRDRGAAHPLFSLSQLLLQGVLKGIGGAGPRPEHAPSEKQTAASEEAIIANIRYLDGVGFFSRDRDNMLDGKVFGRSKR